MMAIKYIGSFIFYSQLGHFVVYVRKDLKIWVINLIDRMTQHQRKRDMNTRLSLLIDFIFYCTVTYI